MSHVQAGRCFYFSINNSIWFLCQENCAFMWRNCTNRVSNTFALKLSSIPCSFQFYENSNNKSKFSFRIRCYSNDSFGSLRCIFFCSCFLLWRMYMRNVFIFHWSEFEKFWVERNEKKLWSKQRTLGKDFVLFMSRFLFLAEWKNPRATIQEKKTGHKQLLG